MARTAASVTEDAFLQTILESPDDDTPRLVFADWLEERGNPRGTFIRLQCQRAVMTPHDPGFKEVLAQESVLFRAHEAEWSKPIARLVDAWEYRRGFIERVTLTATKFLKNAERLFRLAPVRGVQLTHLQFLMPRIVECPQLAKVHALDLSSNSQGLGSRTLQLLVQSPFVAQMLTLRFFDCALGPASAEVLAGAANLARLQGLLLGRNSLGEEGARLLAASLYLARLRKLDLYDNGILTAGAIALTGAPTFRLTHLNLSTNRVGNEGITAGIASAGSTELRRLDLRDNMISNVGVEALARSPHLQQLAYLDLHGNRVGDRAVQALAATTTLPHLAYLNLEGNEFGAAAAQTLATSTNFPRMRQLLLGRGKPPNREMS